MEGTRRLAVWGELRLDGRDPGLRPRERGVLEATAFEHPRPAPVERIVELVWGDAAPATARKAVHNHVRRLRQRLTEVVETSDAGYRLAEGIELDVETMARLAAWHPDATAQLGPSHTESEENAGYVSTRAEQANTNADAVPIADVPARHLERVLGASMGEPFADLASTAEVVGRRQRLRQLRAAVEDRHLHRVLAEGAPELAAMRAEALVADDPDRERRWWYLALALARAGRRREALAAIGEARAHLAGSGLDLGVELTSLERLIIRGDPLLDVSTILSTPQSPGVVDAPATGPVGVGSVLERVRSQLDGSDATAVLLLRGEAGAGKTTIARAAIDEALGLDRTVYLADCDPDPARPLAPVVSVLEQVARREPEALAVAGLTALGVLSPTLADAVGQSTVPPDHHQLLDAVGRVTRSLVRPALVVIEDLHWAPPLTLEAVAALVGGAARADDAGDSTSPRGPVVLLTARPTDDDLLGETPLATMDIPPWSLTDTLTWLAPREPDPDRRAAAARWLLAQTAGSPMFIRELTLALLDEDRLGDAAQGPFTPPGRVPVAIRSALASRVERLAPAAQRCLEVAAVLGTRPRADLLGRIGSWSDVGLALLLDAGLLVRTEQEDVFAFEHELTRLAALERLGPASQAEVHHLALLAMEDLQLTAATDPATLARHAVGAARLDPQRAADVACDAAQAAHAGAAHREAGRWWLTAAEVTAEHRPDDRAGWCHLQIRAGQALLLVGDPRAADLLFEAAADAEHRQDWETAARAAIAVCRLGPTSTAGRPHDEATALCDRLLDRLSGSALRASLAAAASMAHSLTGTAGRCRELFTQAAADAEADGLDETAIEVYPYSYLALAAPDDLDDRERVTERLLAAAERLGRPDARWSALHLRFSNQLQRGDPELRATAAELMELTPMVGERQRAWEQCYVAATVAHLDGDLAASEVAIIASLEFTDTIASSRVLAVYGVQLLALRFSAGRLGELVDSITSLADDQPEVGAWRAALALAAAHGEQLDVARAAIDAVVSGRIDLAQDYTYTGALVALGEAAVALADRERAAPIEALLAPWVGRWSWVGTCTLGPVDTTLAGLAGLRGDAEGARALASSAVDSAEALAAPGFARAARSRRTGHRSP